MFDDDPRPETLSPADIRETEFSREQVAVFHTIKVNSYWFIAIHACVFVIAAYMTWWHIPDDYLALAVWAFLGAFLVSTILAFCQIEIALRNASVLRWWMIALGTLPWMIIATETSAVVLMLAYR